METCDRISHGPEVGGAFYPIMNKGISEVAIEITKRCNLSCRFCIIKNNHIAERDVSFHTVKKIMDQMRSLGINIIRFTGGEPFLHPKIIEMLKYAKWRRFSVIVNTNASLLCHRDIEILEKNSDMVLVSLNSCSQCSEKSVSGNAGLWNQRIANIARLCSSKIRFVVVGTVISKILIKKWVAHYNFMKKNRVRNWWFFRPTDCRDKIYSLSRNDLLLFIDKIYEYNSRSLKLSIANAVPFCMGENIKKIISCIQEGYHCNGYSQLVWDARGYFKPTYFININLGNTLRRALVHSYMQKLKDNLAISFCKGCVLFEACLGGSRYWAKKRYKNYFAPDPLVDTRSSSFLKA